MEGYRSEKASSYGNDENMNEQDAWFMDQIKKSKFFREKLHNWKMIEITDELDMLDGSKYDWDLNKLKIKHDAWKNVIHMGIKPIMAFMNPEIIYSKPERVRYYRMLAMASQKSMMHIGLNVNKFEDNATCETSDEKDNILKIARHLNNVISTLMEYGPPITLLEMTLWRGMGAGNQAQGSWHNSKGANVEARVKELICRRLIDTKKLNSKLNWATSKNFDLIDRKLIFSSEPDVRFQKSKKIEIAIEIKGGIDSAGALERYGAALKSLGKVRKTHPNVKTILLLEKTSLTPEMHDRISEESTIDQHYTLDSLFDNTNLQKFFDDLEI